MDKIPKKRFYPVRSTKRQRALLKAVVEDPHATNAELAIRAGYSSPNEVSNAKRSVGFLTNIAKAMEARPNLQYEPLLQKLEDGLESETVKFFQSEGNVIESRATPDMAERRQYLELALKLRGDLTPKAASPEDPASKSMIQSIMEGLERAAAKGIIPPCPIDAEIVNPTPDQNPLGDLI